MWDLKACIVCFSASSKLTGLSVGNIRQQFSLVTGLKTSRENGMPDYLCVVCLAYVRKFIKFREKCQRSYFTLQCILDANKEINQKDLEAINCKSLNIMPSLSYINLKRAHYEQVVFKWTKDCRSQHLTTDVIPVVHCPTLTSEETFENVMKEIEVEFTKSPIKEEDESKPSLERMDTTISDSRTATDITNDDQYPDSDSYDHFEDTNDTDLVDNDKADGSVIDERYATIIPISVTEAKAALEVKKFFMNGDFKCDCGWATNKEDGLATHKRMHDKHISGNFHCEICDYYYKTNFVLQTHMNINHMYKYLCKICNEVHFDRCSSKQHYITAHHQLSLKQIRKPRKRKINTGFAKGYNKGVKKVPEQFLEVVPVKPLEQYEMIEMRKQSKNYTEANYKCELCYRGFRSLYTFNRHMVKHDSSVSGKMKCDMCKLFFPDTRKLYKHMNMNHLTKYLCKICKFYTTNRTQAIMHYRWHKNVTYDCPHCDRKFLKLSTRLTHIRLKHPSTCMCNLCGHSFVSSHGLTMHKRFAHTKKENEDSKALLKSSVDKFYCVECDVEFLNEEAYTTHLTSSSKHVDVNIACLKTEQVRLSRTRGVSGRAEGARGAGGGRGRRPRAFRSDVHNNGVVTPNKCELCDEILASDVQTKKHYELQHPGADCLKRYMCDTCGHTTKQYSNLLAHMRTHTNEKPYQCQYCDRRFSMPSNRDRHLVVHTGEKPYECQHCSRRFTQSTAMKLHIQTVHMKIPYAPWDKKKRKRRKEMEPTTAEVNIVAPQLPCLVQPQPKLLLDNQGDYINAYITYADD